MLKIKTEIYKFIKKLGSKVQLVNLNTKLEDEIGDIFKYNFTLNGTMYYIYIQNWKTGKRQGEVNYIFLYIQEGENKIKVIKQEQLENIVNRLELL